MREYEEKGFNPIKFGLVGAIIIAGVVALLLWFHSYSETNEALQQELTMLREDLGKAKQENLDLQKKIDTLTEETNTTSAQLKKQIQQRDSQLLTAKRTLDSESKAANTKLAELKKNLSDAETEITQQKKSMDQKTQEVKRLQEQVSKMQADLNRIRAESEKQGRAAADLQKKLKRITEGDQAAADVMVQQLAEARRELLESLADFDDGLLEQLLEDKVPASAEIYEQLKKDLAEDLIVPVLFGSAEQGHGITRLWKALRHETPEHDAAAWSPTPTAGTSGC